MKIIKTILFNSETNMPDNPDSVRVYVDMTNKEFEEFKKKVELKQNLKYDEDRINAGIEKAYKDNKE